MAGRESPPELHLQFKHMHYLEVYTVRGMLGQMYISVRAEVKKEQQQK